MSVSRFSRRGLLACSGAIPTLVPLLTADDPTIAVCESWLNSHVEEERLGLRWQEIENRAFVEHDWAKLNRTQRARHREQYEMDALYDRMDELHAQNQTLLASLPTIVATTNLGICGKLAVAAIEVCPEENEDAHRLIASILRDYRTLHGA